MATTWDSKKLFTFLFKGEPWEEEDNEDFLASSWGEEHEHFLSAEELSERLGSLREQQSAEEDATEEDNYFTRWMASEKLGIRQKTPPPQVKVPIKKEMKPLDVEVRQVVATPNGNGKVPLSRPANPRPCEEWAYPIANDDHGQPVCTVVFPVTDDHVKQIICAEPLFKAQQVSEIQISRGILGSLWWSVERREFIAYNASEADPFDPGKYAQFDPGWYLIPAAFPGSDEPPDGWEVRFRVDIHSETYTADVTHALFNGRLPDKKMADGSYYKWDSNEG